MPSDLIDTAVNDVLANRITAARKSEPSEEYRALSLGIAEGRPFAGFAANDNFSDDELPTAIPPDKAAMRAEIERLTAGHTVISTGKKVVTLAGLAELQARREEILRQARMPFVSTGVDLPKPANDNREPQSWPLAEALRRGRREADITVCEVYRGLWSVMTADPLQGRDPEMGDEDEEEVHIESRSTINGKEALDKFGIVAGTGEIEYKGVRQLAKTPGASRKASHKGDGSSGDRYQVTTARFNETTLITQIDMRTAWARLRNSIRPLLTAFEDACLDGATFTEIGEARDFKGKQASAAGKALVFEAIDALSQEWLSICVDARDLETQANGNVVRFRAKRERALNIYLGKAA
ncbi:MAG: hypothetical protein ACOH2N_11225 [Devosia sp.]